MRLHLPKTLLAAVLAACAALPTWADTQYGWKDGAPAKTGDSGDLEAISYTEVNDTPSGSITVTTDGASYTLGANSLSSFDATGKDVKFTGPTNGNGFLRGTTQSTANSVWLTGGRYENGINKLGNLNGITNVYITGAQIYAQSDSAQTLTSIYFLGTGADSGTLRLDGNADVTFSKQTTLVGDASITKTSGTGKAIFTGLNLGNYTFTIKGGKAVEASEVVGGGNVTLNDSSTLALSGDNTIGTLTLSAAANSVTVSSGTTTVSTISNTNTGSIILNGGTLAVSDTGDFSISGVKFAGGVLDVSSVTGTLTVGGTWTGDFVEKSVKVINANNATIAGSLATSLNPSSLLNYMFKAGDADAGESASSVYRVRRAYITATATVDSTQKNRIVIGSVTGADGSTAFSNVGLNELLAGDTVTIGGLTGWIGDNTSNSILADLEFTGQNHINNGSSSNSWITYSGAITGNGTLSYEWSGANYTYNFNGDLSGFTGTISDTTTLNVTIGGTLANGVSNAVNATIDIAGALTVNREASFAKAITVGGKLIVKADSSIAGGTVTGNMDLKSGALTINGNVTLQGGLDMKGGDTTGGACRGHLSVAKGGTLNVSGNIWVLENSAKILLAEGGKLEWNGLTFTGKTAVENVETGLKFGDSENLQLSNGEHTVTNSVITSTGTKTLSWTLTDTDLVVQSGTLRLGANVNASNVTVSAGSTLELVSGWQQKLSSSNTTWKSGATLRYVSTNAVDLDVGTVSGSTIEMNCVKGTLNAANAESEVVVEGDIKLTGTATAAAAEFTTIVGKSYTFNGGVAGGGNLNLNQANKTTALIFEGDLSGWTSQSTSWSGLYANAGIINATISGAPAQTAVKNAFNAASGAQLNLTIDRDAILTNTVNITSLAVNAKKTLSLSDDNNAVAVGSTTVGDEAKLVIGNKAESTSIDLGTVSGSGTISSERNATQSVTLGTGADNAFTGTLEATKGQLNVTAKKVQTLAGLTANGGNVDVMNATSLSVTDMVIGDNATVGVYSESDKTTESSLNIYGSVNSKASLTIGSDATLNANLFVSYAKLEFNGGPLAMGSTLTLFADGSSELLGIDLTTVTATGLTLFTGVDGFSTGWDPASDDAVTIDDAHDIFGNLSAGAYSLKYTGGTNGDVLLIANNPTPEPTTATLSLLALMGLAARRRRKA